MRRRAHRAMSAFRRTFWPRREGPAILLYHRVTTLRHDPWNLAVSPAHFNEQLQVLKSAGHCLTIRQLVHARRTGEVPFPCFVLTFDDGYLDNLTNAFPLLERYGIPATLFLVSGMLNSTEEFWWDAVDRALLTPGRRPAQLSFTLDGRRHKWDLGSDADYSESSYEASARWRATSDHPPTNRQKLFLEVWRLLYNASSEARTSAVAEILRWAEMPATARSSYAVMSHEQARRLAWSELIEVGAHGVTISPLTEVPLTTRKRELAGSKDELEIAYWTTGQFVCLSARQF